MPKTATVACIGLDSCTCFIFALNIVAGDGTVPIESHGPAEGDGPLFHLTNLHFRRLWWLWEFNDTVLRFSEALKPSPHLNNDI